MVSLEIVKFWQALFMSSEYLMFDEEQDMAMRAQSSNLNEELGQIEYVFSDKTGTLTCNIMEFKKFSAGTTSYGTGQRPTEPQLSNVSFVDPKFTADLKTAQPHEDLHKVMMFLAACHTIIIDEKKGTFNAASPDELALVHFAKQFGFVFSGKDANDNILIEERDRNDQPKASHKFKLLHVCEFSSARKRMSVILQIEKRILLMCKGADSVVEERLSPSSKNGSVMRKTQEFVDEYATEGLRTLFLAQRDIDV